MNYYTVYKRGNDELVAFGNAAQCTKMLGFKTLNSFRCMICNVRSGKNRKYEVVISEDEEGENE